MGRRIKEAISVIQVRGDGDLGRMLAEESREGIRVWVCLEGSGSEFACILHAVRENRVKNDASFSTASCTADFRE